MKRTWFSAICCIAMAFVFGMAHAETPISVSLNVSHPKESTTKSGDSKPTRSVGRHSKAGTEVKTSIYEYSGKISCSPPKGKNATVKLEAYFITRALGEKGAKDELSQRREIDTYEFGGENPTTCKFTFTSPPIEQTTVTTVTVHRNRGWRRGGSSSASTEKEKTGKRLMGVILRAMVDGKPVKVISEPSNSQWVAAGKKQTVELK